MYLDMDTDRDREVYSDANCGSNSPCIALQANPVANVLDPSSETFLSSDENVDHQLLVKAMWQIARPCVQMGVQVHIHVSLYKKRLCA